MLRKTSILSRTAVGGALLAATIAGCGSDEASEADTTEPAPAEAEAEDEAEAEAPAPEEEAPDSSSDTTVTPPAEEEAPSAEGSSFDEVIAAAEAEDKLVVYSVHGPERLKNLASAFEEEYPDIEIEAIRLSDADLLATVESELATDDVKASLLVSTQIEWVEDMSDAGTLVAPSGPMFEDGSLYDYNTYVRQGDIIEVGAAVLSFAWNTDLYPAGITDYPDLLDPALGDGKLGTIDAGLSSTQVDYYLWMERNFGEDFVDGIAAQNPRIYPSSLPTNEALISGEIYAAVYASPYGLAQAKADGAPVDFAVSPTAGGWGAKHLAMLMADAPSPNAALVFLNFMLSPQGQEQSQAVTASVLDDIPGTLTTNASVEDLDREGQKPENVEKYLERWNSLFR